MALPSPHDPIPDPLEIRRRIGHNVRVVMRARRVSEEQIADALSLNQGSVSKRLSGKIPFRADELELVARRLNVDVGLLYSQPDELFRTESK